MIEVKDIKKEFKLYKKPSDRLKEIFFRKNYHTIHQALNGISFRVEDGETLGIIGQNGAGKSTILKILMGVILPDSGEIYKSGSITGLLELGTGFNMEMRGEENIYMNGMLIGMSREEIDSKKEEIIAFTELGDFIYEPIKTYSSGMVMRLAFSIAIHANPKCFLVDEALSVGDAHFQQKCMKKIREFKESGGSIIFVSHDMNAVKMLCDKAILLNRGIVIEEGKPEEVVNRYNFLISKINDKDDIIKVENESKKSYGNFEIEIKDVTIIGEKSKSNILSAGENSIIKIKLHSKGKYENITIGIHIRDKFGQDIYGTNTFYQNFPISLEEGDYICSYKMPLNIGVGKYTIGSAIHTGDWHTDICYHWLDFAEEFEVTGLSGNFFIGVCKLDPEIEIKKIG